MSDPRPQPPDPERRQQFERICNDFELAWKSGARPRLEEYLVRGAEQFRAWLLKELLVLELTYRRRAKEEPEEEEYLRRFPADASVVKQVFDQTLTDGLPVYIGKYRVVERLGSGAQGQTFRAVHPELRRDVVVKVSRFGLSEAEAQRLINEATILARLDDPGTVKVYEAGRLASRLYVVYEHVSARSLAEVLRRKRFSLGQAVTLVAGLAATLERVHCHGVLHLDLKPANVLIDGEDRPRLIDFGLSYQAPGWDAVGQPVDGVYGTPAYMAPEQAEGVAARLCQQTDVYGLGAILYELLTNRPPFAGETVEGVLEKVRLGIVVPPRRLNPRVPPELERICMRALARAPEDRFGSAGEMARALVRYEQGPSRRAVGVALMLMLVLVCWLVWLRVRPATKTDEALPVLRLNVLHYKHVQGKDVLIGIMGDESQSARIGDRVSLIIESSHPVHFYLIACNFDGKEQLLWPCTDAPPNLGDRQRVPPRLARLRFPLINQQTLKSRLIALDDDVTGGTQVFLLAASRQPLPAYEDWVRKRGPMPWKKLPRCVGVWRCDGTTVELIAEGNGRVRGKQVDHEGQPPLLPLCRWALGNGVEAVEAIAFPVVER
jgi:serine/threonine protein kinase